MGLFPERKVGKKRFILVIVDMLTRRAGAGAGATTGAGGANIVRGVREWMMTGGGGRLLFCVLAFARPCSLKSCGSGACGGAVIQEYSPPYHHSSIGFVERFNQTLLKRLRRMWVEEPQYIVKTVERAMRIYNDTPLSSSEESKETPSSFVSGSPTQTWNAPLAVWDQLRQHAREQRERANHKTRGRQTQRMF